MNYDSGFTDGFVTTQAGKLHYKLHEGSGIALVFLHGGGYSTLVWKRLVEYLPDNFKVVLVDLLGHGLSDAPRTDYTVRVQVLALGELIGSLGLGEPVLFGHSYGGWVAATYASQNRVSKLVLEAPAGAPREFRDIEEKTGAEEFRRQLFMDLIRVHGNKDYVMHSMLSGPFPGEQLTNDVLGKISAPTLVIWGEKDRLIAPGIAEAFKSGIRESSVSIIKDAGHSPHYTSPEMVAKLVLEFLGVG